MSKFHFVILFFSFSAFSQGPVDGFFKGKGNLDLAISGSFQHSEKFYMGFNTIDYVRTLTSVSLFAEVGVTNNFDVIANIPFINGQFQDASFFVKYGLPFDFCGEDSPFHIVPALGISFPLSNYATQASQAIGQRATQIQPKLILQYQLKHGFFIQAQSGYNYTLDPVPSSIPISAKFGFSKNKIYSDVWFDYQKGLGDIEWIGGASQDFRTLYVTYSKFGGVFYYAIRPKVGIFINGSYILSGINLGKSFTIGAGFVYKFKFIGPTNK